MLPTEDRFLRLSEHQKELLYFSFFETPLDEDIHYHYRSSEETVITDDEADNLMKAGYTDEQIKRMRDQLAIANADGGI